MVALLFTTGLLQALWGIRLESRGKRNRAYWGYTWTLGCWAGAVALLMTGGM